VSVLRNLIADLVAKRLWPVAVALAVGLVAVPVVLGRGAAAPAPAPASAVAQAPVGAPSSRAAVTLEQTPSTARRDIGSVRNPFKAPKSATPAKTATPAASTPAASGDTSTSPGGGSSAPTGGDNSTTTTKPSTPSTPDPIDTYRLTLRFGQAGDRKVHKDVARLTPLPSLDQPFFVFMGVLKDGKTAVFLVSSDVTATGDGTCKPTAASCQTIELKEGDTEFFDLAVDGVPVQYQLDIIHLRKNDTQSATAAAASAQRHSKAGAALLRGAHMAAAASFQGLAAYRWLPAAGLLEAVPEKALAHGASTAAGKAEVPIVGEPVWHWRLQD
jgi:hypothetical protein